MRNVKCIVCDSDKFNKFCKQDFPDLYLDLIGIDYSKIERHIVECSKCGFKLHNPQIDLKEAALLYEKFRDASLRGETPDQYFDRIVNLPDCESENHKKIEWLKEYLPNLKKDGRILDIGCGGGVFLHRFSTHYPTWSLFGVEPTTEFSELAKRRTGANIVSGNYEFGLFEESFDLIVINQVLEHVLDVHTFLSNVHKELSVDGACYLEVPDVSDFDELPENHDRFLMQHLWFFDESSLTALLVRSGYKVLRIEVKRTLRGRNNLVALISKA